jgi:hypothetical protein
VGGFDSSNKIKWRMVIPKFTITLDVVDLRICKRLALCLLSLQKSALAA